MTISPPVALPPFPSDPRLASSGSGSSCVFAPLLVTILALARSALAALVPLSLGLSGFGFNGYSSRSRLGLILHLGSSRLGRRYRNHDLYDLSRPITTYHDLSRPITTFYDPSRPFTTFYDLYDLLRPFTTFYDLHDLSRPPRPLTVFRRTLPCAKASLPCSWYVP